MKKFFPIYLFVVLAAVSCNNNPVPGSENAQSDGNAVVTKKGKYGIRSGIVEYKTTVMGMDANQTLFFDDYGAKEATQVEMDMMGMKIRTYTLTKDGTVYNFDPDKKTGTKSTLSAQSGTVDFENISQEVQKEMKLKKVGEENFLGKTCDKFTIDYEKMKMTGDYLVWKGIALKTNVDMGSMKIALYALKVEENVVIPAEKFEIPADIKFN
jgi:hypothetical protein